MVGANPGTRYQSDQRAWSLPAEISFDPGQASPFSSPMISGSREMDRAWKRHVPDLVEGKSGRFPHTQCQGKCGLDIPSHIKHNQSETNKDNCDCSKQPKPNTQKPMYTHQREKRDGN